jgi:Ca2+-binding EF-hand superfamily protein
MKSMAWAAGVALACALPITAAAQDQPAGDSFATMDRSGDGSVDWDEFRNRMAGLFHDLDKDNDKILRGAENFPVYDEQGKEMPSKDVTNDEFMSAAETAFMMADADGNGSLSRDEAGMPAQ